MNRATDRLRKISTTPATFYMGESYCAFYWAPCKWDYKKWANGTEEEAFALYLSDRKLLLRYQRYCHYVKEVLPEWKQIREICFADNSIEVVEQNKYGQTRQRMTSGPWGD